MHCINTNFVVEKEVHFFSFKYTSECVILKLSKSVLISVWLETSFIILVTRLQKVFWMPFSLKQISAVVAFGLLKMLWYTKLLNLNKYFLPVMHSAYLLYALLYKQWFAISNVNAGFRKRYVPVMSQRQCSAVHEIKHKPYEFAGLGSRS